MGLLFQVLGWAVWWGGLVAIINIDQSRRDAAAKQAGSVNFEDKSVLPYILLGAICGGLVLPVYFYATRKTVPAALAGVGLGIALFAIVAVINFVGTMLTHPHLL